MKSKKKTNFLHCLNCNHPFTGNEKFCPECGQKNKDKKIGFNSFIREVFAGFFSWDSKFWRTLFPLLTKPGKIPEDYVQGKRARYTNPFRFFISTSIIFFLIFSLNINIKGGLIEVGDTSKTKKDTIRNASMFGKEISHYLAFQKKYPKIKTSEALDSLSEPKTFFNKLAYSKAKTINEFKKDTDTSVTRLTKQAVSYFSTALFILLPLLTLFLFIIHNKIRHTYIHHLIFVFNIHTFILLLLTIVTLIISLFTNIEAVAKNITIIIIATYTFLAMKRFYKQSFFMTLFKLLMTSIVYLALTIIGFSAVFMLSFMMM